MDTQTPTAIKPQPGTKPLQKQSPLERKGKPGVSPFDALQPPVSARRIFDRSGRSTADTAAAIRTLSQLARLGLAPHGPGTNEAGKETVKPFPQPPTLSKQPIQGEMSLKKAKRGSVDLGQKSTPSTAPSQEAIQRFLDRMRSGENPPLQEPQERKPAVPPEEVAARKRRDEQETFSLTRELAEMGRVFLRQGEQLVFGGQTNYRVEDTLTTSTSGATETTVSLEEKRRQRNARLALARGRQFKETQRRVAKQKNEAEQRRATTLAEQEQKAVQEKSQRLAEIPETGAVVRRGNIFKMFGRKGTKATNTSSFGKLGPVGKKAKDQVINSSAYTSSKISEAAGYGAILGTAGDRPASRMSG